MIDFFLLQLNNEKLHNHINELEQLVTGYKQSWESAEKRNGELERNLKSLRELQELEIGEIMERETRIMGIIKVMPIPPGQYPVTEILSEWIDNYTDWHKRMMEHLSDEQK